MARPRFTRKLEGWFTEQHADAVEAIADERQLTASAVLREALAFYFKAVGITPAARPNGPPAPALPREQFDPSNSPRQGGQ
ncbi:hypothetical protein IVB27_38560 [Bradyrhizobium sp. 197]|uniref:hypothetical protein n=1 Tax=Bradyrhizobium sp. 197 TaxID=2782663 RepID=UPI001FF8DD43|nr:hypothetical protein [Bradyrhizobium sp. 197]MCK1480482.1 hypothetical protein [Bradyrhizobium sp. 197]